MDEYIQTLRIRAESGHPEAVKAYKDAIAHQASVQKSTQRFASDLRYQGTDVTYRLDGGIEFKLGEPHDPNCRQTSQAD